MKKLVSLIFLCICLLHAQALPCTTFLLDNNGQPIYGKNMDFQPMAAYVLINKRGVAKTTVPTDTDPVATWTSKYGSITFNWLARELPFEGINEAGLFVSAMGGGDISELPEPDSRPAMSPDQWIQYQLDNFSTVDEVIAGDKIIRIEKPVFHFMVCDSQGNCAVIEFPKGKQVCHIGETLPFKVDTNTTYDQSLEVLSHFLGFGGYLPIPRGNLLMNLSFYLSKDTNSFLRFVRAADMLQKYDPQTSGPAVDYAFDTLEYVAMMGGRSMWRTVYDIGNNTIYLVHSYLN